jgi:glycosyltransferase involved in cell wall biosynthesis
LLLIVGSGRLEGRLREVAREAGIEGDVRFPGSVPDEALPDYYRAADLFVLPSRGLEAFGLVTLEALASGLPVVGTDVGGTGEILRPLDPRLVTGTGPEALATAIERAHRDGLRAPGFSERCRAYALERFPWERAVDALERSYRAALEGGG